MFESLTQRLQDVFRNLRGMGKLSEANIASALREVRLALVEADVNYDVAVAFVEAVGKKALGREVLRSISPGQQVIKVVHEELVALLGGAVAPLAVEGSPLAILLVGLNGSGKTTTAGKLARRLISAGRQPLLVACDVYRPAAREQLQAVGAQAGAPVFTLPGELDVARIAARAFDFAKAQGRNLLVFDTAGRFQVDEELMDELARLKDVTRPREILLVADAATGQEAARVAKAFDERLGLSGFILSKLDGDARGGAALSIHAITKKPIKFTGLGEKIEDLDVFYPDRMASRILGMGDVLSLVEKAQQAMDEEKTAALEKKLRAKDFSLQDFLDQLAAMRKMGPLENLLEMLPGAANLNAKDLSVGEKQLARAQAIIQSMTAKERAHPEILNGKRRLRIAKGSGTTVTEVNDLLKRFGMTRKMMQNMGNMGKMMSRLGGMPGRGVFR
ncbi:MAG: signal recognition particle protein [Verrucomicrobiae bacterium]|nr:signal recognition particle protein [Verrucomicrobiae bacterium]